MTASNEPHGAKGFLLGPGIFIALLALWLILHLLDLQQKFLWHDEYFSLLFAAGRSQALTQSLKATPFLVTNAAALREYLAPDSAGNIFSFLANLAHDDIHPPLFYLLLRLPLLAGMRSPALLSGLPLLIFGAALIVLYRLGKALVPWPYYHLAPALWVFSATAWVQAIELRQYGLLFLASALCLRETILAASSPARRSSRSFPLRLGALMALGLYTQYTFLWIVVAVNLWALALFFRRHRKLRPFLLADLAGLFLFLPGLFLAVVQFGSQLQRQTLETDAAELGDRLAYVVFHLFLPGPGLQAVSAAAIGLAILCGLAWPGRRELRSLFVLLLLACLGLPTLLVGLNLLHIPHLYQPRYFVTLAPGLILAMTLGIANLPWPPLRPLAAAALLAAVVIGFGGFYRTDFANRAAPSGPSPYDAIVSQLEARLPPRGAVITNANYRMDLVKAASTLAPDRVIVAGRCPALQRELPAWLRAHQPPMAMILYKEYPGEPAPEECLAPLVAAVSDLYAGESLPYQYRRHRVMFLRRR